MQIHTLQPKTKNAKKKRVGRGGARGAYAGRGQKGQKSRSGTRKPKTALQVVYKIPKLRGSKMRPAKEVVRVTLSGLEKYAKDGVITKDAILTRARDKKKQIKILASGEVSSPYTIVGIPLSKQAAEKIKKAGGKVQK